MRGLLLALVCVAAMAAAAVIGGIAAPASATVGATATVPALYDNCTNFNKRYPHGVGRAHARDITKSRRNPVTTFVRNTRLYNIAMRWNRDLDRDRDGIACEKK